MATVVLSIIMEFAVPGIGGTIVEALSVLSELCDDMNENEVLCYRVLERLQCIWDELQRIEDEVTLRNNKVLPKFGKTIFNFMEFLKKHSRKKLLSRVASSRKLVNEVQELHKDIDVLFMALNLVHIAEMSAWKTQWEKDMQAQQEQMQQLVSNMHLILSELTGGALVEALMELKYEVEKQGSNNTPEHVKLMTATFSKVVRQSKTKVPRLPEWFIPQDDVKYDKNPFDEGSYGKVHHGTYSNGTRVVIKRLLMSGDEAQEAFFKEVEIWWKLKHQHVITLYGGCHVGTPFFVCDDASNGNFVEYFDNPNNKHRMWRLFHETALGLAHLHEKRVVHGDLKCNNLLVGADMKAKICDFGFSFIRRQSIALSAKPQTEAMRWKALECMNGTPEDPSNPRFESDVYSFGMCIIEAVSGAVPWGMTDDETILDKLVKGVAHPRPEGLTDKQWKLVSELCKIDVNERIPLKTAISKLKKFADEEESEELRLESLRKEHLMLESKVECPTCSLAVDSGSKFCNHCGERLDNANTNTSEETP